MWFVAVVGSCGERSESGADGRKGKTHHSAEIVEVLFPCKLELTRTQTDRSIHSIDGSQVLQQ